MNIQINPYIRRAWYDQLHSGTVIGPRVIYDYELLYVKAGKCVITVEERVYEAGAGDIFLFRPRVKHTIAVDAATIMIQPHIHFDLNRLPDSELVPVSLDMEMKPEDQKFFRPDELAELMPSLPDCVHPGDTSLLEHMITDVIYTHANCTTILDEIKVRYLFLQLLYKVLYEMQLVAHRKSRSKGATAQRVKTYLDHNNHRSLTLDEIAAECFVSKCYMISAFKEAYGITPYQYHIRQRIDEAKYMLCFTTSTISEIASSMGFESIQAFSALFKHQEGMSPSSYRDMLLETSVRSPENHPQ